MHRAAKNNPNFVVPLSAEFMEASERFGRSRLCQLASLQIIDRTVDAHILTSVGDALMKLAETAFASRQLNLLGEASRILTSLPLGREYNIAGLYFGALERHRRGDSAGERILNAVISEPSHRYTARAIQSLGAISHARSDFTSALKLYAEAGRCTAHKRLFDPLVVFYSQQNIAVIKGAAGDHLGALENLERLIPFVRAVGSAYPHMRYDLSNNIAVKLAEVGRLEEARRTSEIAIASPFAHAYPEWQETFDDIECKRRRASRSTVAVPQLTTEPERGEFPTGETQVVRRGTAKSNKLVSLHERPTSIGLPEYARGQTPARVLDFQQWKEKVNPDFAHATAFSHEQRSEMTIGEKLIRLMDLISHDDTDDETIDVILEAVEAIVIQRRGAS